MPIVKEGEMSQRKGLGRLTLAAALAVVISGCASLQTGYHEMSFTGGVKNFALSPDTYAVYAEGNALTPYKLVEKYLLYHAAEVTLDRGYDNFTVVELGGRKQPVPAGNGVRYGLTAIIKLTKGVTPSGSSSYDASSVKQRLRATVGASEG